MKHAGRGDPDHEDRLRGIAMLGTIMFFALIGTGVGVFYEAGLLGTLIGGAVGIVIGLWLVPRLMEERD